MYVPNASGGGSYINVGTTEQVQENLSDFATFGGKTLKIAKESGALDEGLEEYKKNKLNNTNNYSYNSNSSSTSYNSTYNSTYNSNSMSNTKKQKVFQHTCYSIQSGSTTIQYFIDANGKKHRFGWVDKHIGDGNEFTLSGKIVAYVITEKKPDGDDYYKNDQTIWYVKKNIINTKKANFSCKRDAGFGKISSKNINDLLGLSIHYSDGWRNKGYRFTDLPQIYYQHEQ
jgi:hypothetical protein